MGKISRKGYQTGDLRLFTGIPSAMPAGFTLADHRIADIADFPRLFARVGQAWKLGTDSYDEGLQFRIPDGSRLLRGASYSVTSSGGLSLVAGAAGIAGNVVTFSGGFGIVASGGGSGPRYYAVTLTHAPTAGELLRVALVDAPAAPPANFVYIEATSAGWTVAGPSGDGFAVGYAVPPADGDSLIVYRDGGTGAWGVIFPDGSNSGDLSATTGSFVGDGVPQLMALMAGAVTYGASGALSAPVGYTAFPAGGTVVTADVGTRAGSTDSGAHALAWGEMPAHQHYAVNDTVGNGDLSAWGATGVINQASNGGLPGGNDYTLQGSLDAPTQGVTSIAGSGEAHSHTLDPEHVKVLVLVKT